MSSRRGVPTDPLGAIERLRELELEQARAEHSRTEVAVQEQRKCIQVAEEQISTTRAFEASLLQEKRAVPLESLRQALLYIQWQSGLLVQQRDRLSSCIAAEDEARSRVREGFQQLTAIRRLRQRRARSAAEEALRKEQRTIDAQATLRRIAGY